MVTPRLALIAVPATTMLIAASVVCLFVCVFDIIIDNNSNTLFGR
jgi:hypothetical protein